MNPYRTIQGDMWDGIAFKVYGSEAYMNVLLEANPEYAQYIQSGIKRVVYGEKYRLTEGIDLLERARIEVEYLNLEDNESEQE